MQGRYEAVEDTVYTCRVGTCEEEGSGCEYLGVWVAAWRLVLTYFLHKAMVFIHFCSWFSLTTLALPSSCEIVPEDGSIYYSPFSETKESI